MVDMEDMADMGVEDVAKAVPVGAADVVKAARAAPVAVLVDARAASGNFSAKRKSASSVSKRSI